MKPSEILRQLQKFPRKMLGQNFLVDDSVAEDMIEAAEVSQDDTIVEIGPGLGALTFPLLTHAARVIAIEADREFATYLRHKKSRQLTVVTGDALKIDWAVTIDGAYKVVANIPYSITFPLLRQTFLLEHKPQVIVLLVQREVAQRLVAKPGTKERGLPTVRAEANAEVKIIRIVKPGSFYPRPKVESAIVRLKIISSRDEEIFWPAVEAGFRHRRQTLANSLCNDLKIPKVRSTEILTEASIKPLARPQELSFEDWQKLSLGLKKVLF